MAESWLALERVVPGEGPRRRRARCSLERGAGVSDVLELRRREVRALPAGPDVEVLVPHDVQREGSVSS